MKPIYILLACLLLPGVVPASPTTGTNPDTSAKDTDLAAQVQGSSRSSLATQKQMARAQQREIETLKAQSKDGATLTVTNEPTPSPSEIPAADPSTRL